MFEVVYSLNLYVVVIMSFTVIMYICVHMYSGICEFNERCTFTMQFLYFTVVPLYIRVNSKCTLPVYLSCL